MELVITYGSSVDIYFDRPQRDRKKNNSTRVVGLKGSFLTLKIYSFVLLIVLK